MTAYGGLLPVGTLLEKLGFQQLVEETLKVKGLRARGGMEVDLAWKNHKAVSTTLRATADGWWRLRAPAGQKITGVRTARQAVPLKPQPDGSVEVRLAKGADCQVTLG